MNADGHRSVIAEQAQEIDGLVEKIIRLRSGERFAGIEAPSDCGDGHPGFLRGLHVAQLVTDVEHFPGPQREGLADRFEVLGLAGELGGGGNEIELLAQAVGPQE